MSIEDKLSKSTFEKENFDERFGGLILKFKTILRKN